MYDINFISREDFKGVVKQTMLKYQESLIPYNLAMFNSSIIDPVKLLFDNKLSGESWSNTIKREIDRQRDKSNNNEIGVFHQQLFRHIENCEVPSEGWDVIYTLPNSNDRKIFVEMKNKHNTMNSSSSQRTYTRMQNQLLHNDNCECYLVEVIARRSQNIIWETTIDYRSVSHRLIRRVSIDKFYEIVTGQVDAFFKICSYLPELIDELIAEGELTLLSEDTVEYELLLSGRDYLTNMYLLAFSSYGGFE
jgi:hypothetical protein